MTISKATLGGVMVSVTKWLLPPACREHVLGDLQERYRSPLGYLADAVGAVPAAMIGEILKATPLPFIVLEAILVYASFFVAGYSQLSLGPIWADAQPSQLAAMTGIVMAGLLLRDSRGMQPTLSAFRQILALRNETGLKLTPFHLKLFTVLQLSGGVYLAIFFSTGVAWMWQSLFHTHLFPGIMTSQRGVFIAGLSICPLRIWLGMRRRSRPQST
jgi:hypothetical protein